MKVRPRGPFTRATHDAGYGRRALLFEHMRQNAMDYDINLLRGTAGRDSYKSSWRGGKNI